MMLYKNVSVDMKKIIDGYHRFYQNYFKEQSKYQRLFDTQQPKTMFIACCDSRVDPALLVSAQPGDIFVERNVANVVPHVQDGPNSMVIALQIAVYGFDVDHIIVMGHEQCAGVGMFARYQIGNDPFAPIEYKIREKKLHALFDEPYSLETARDYELANLVLSCKNLISHPFIEQSISNKKLAVHGWYFSLKTGTFDTLCFTCMQFTDLMVECCGKRVM